jgi:hypothetical protein
MEEGEQIMVNELIILLSDQQQQELIKRANQANYDDDLSYLQLQLNNWLENESDEGIGKALAKAMDDKARLEHTEK